MSKRFIAVLLSMLMLVSACTTVSGAQADANITKVVSELAEHSSEDRKAMADALIPLLITNSGLDALEYYLEAYDPASTSTFDVVIKKLLKFTDKEGAMAGLSFMRMIDESVREKYLLGFQSRKERTLTQNTAIALNQLVDVHCNTYPGLRKVLAEDGISNGVIAYLLGMLYEMNNSRPLLTSSDSGFVLKDLDNGLKNKIDSALAGQNGEYQTANQLVSAYVDSLNSKFAVSERELIKIVYGEIGIYTSTQNANPSGGNVGGGDAGSQDVSDIKDGICQKIKKASGKTDYDIVEIYENVKGKKQAYKKLDTPIMVEISVDNPDVAIYKKDGDKLTVVKYSIYDNGKLLCKIDSTGEYAIKTTEYPFKDAEGWGKNYIKALYERGIISGKGADTFAPEDNITREEFVKLVIETTDMPYDSSNVDFDDVDSSEWYAKYIASAYKNNIVSGIGEGKFGVGENITRQDMATILCKVLNRKAALKEKSDNVTFTDEENIADYAKAAVDALAAEGFLAGDEESKFNPINYATRQEAAKLIYKTLEYYIKK